MKLPIKTRLLEYALEENKPFTAKCASEKMMKEYPGEKTAELKWITGLLEGYCGVGVLRASDIEYNDIGELEVKYIVTGFGKKYEKMIPKR